VMASVRPFCFAVRIDIIADGRASSSHPRPPDPTKAASLSIRTLKPISRGCWLACAACVGCVSKEHRCPSAKRGSRFPGSTSYISSLFSPIETSQTGLSTSPTVCQSFSPSEKSSSPHFSVLLPSIRDPPDRGEKKIVPFFWSRFHIPEALGLILDRPTRDRISTAFFVGFPSN